MKSLAHVVVVSNDKVFRAFLQRLLERNQYSCALFQDGFSALNTLSKPGPADATAEIIIVDENLQDGPGADFCLRVRDLKTYFLTPVFLAFDAARISLQEISERSHFACNSYFSKPPEPGTLLAEIEKNLRKFRAQTGDFEIGSELPAKPLRLTENTKPIESKGRIEPSTADVPGLLHHLYMLKFTGRFQMENEGVTRTILILNGKPVIARTTAPQDRIGQRLIRQGLVTKEQVEEGLVLGENPDLRLGQSLVHMGVIELSELYAAIQEQTKSIIFGSFLCHSGRYEIIPDESPNYEEIRLDLDFFALLKEGIGSCFDVDYIVNRLGGTDTVAIPTQHFGPAILSLQLDPAETKVAHLLNSKSTLQEIFDQSQLPELETAQLVYLFYALGAFKVR